MLQLCARCSGCCYFSSQSNSWKGIHTYSRPCVFMMQLAIQLGCIQLCTLLCKPAILTSFSPLSSLVIIMRGRAWNFDDTNYTKSVFVYPSDELESGLKIGPRDFRGRDMDLTRNMPWVKTRIYPTGLVLVVWRFN